jgi:hypothetical protein
MITKEFKQKWITALTDGSFKHGTGSLRSLDHLRNPTGHYCCLGVAAVLMGRQFEDGRECTLLAANGENEINDSLYLPKALSDEIGLSVDIESDLAGRNDAEHEDTFPQSVIDYINALPEREAI